MNVALDWRPLVRTDLTELSGLVTAIEHLDDPSGRHSLDELYETFDAAARHGPRSARDSRNPSADGLIGWAGETPVGFAWNIVFEHDQDPRRVVLTGGVHPGWRRQGIGRHLLKWQVERARVWHTENLAEGHGPLRMLCYVDEKLADRSHLLERAGFGALRWYADMSRPLTDLPVAEVPAGFGLVGYHDQLSEQVRAAHNEAFADHWGSQPVGRASWAESCRRHSFRPDWSVVAVADTGEVAGYAMNSAYQQDWQASGVKEGWTDRIGVRRSYRGNGLAKALLVRSMQSFQAAGLDAAGLGVDADNPTGAFGLYESMGYLAGDKVVLYGRDEPGRDEDDPDQPAG